MWNWYISISLIDRAFFLLLVAGFCFVMYSALLSLISSHRHVNWYRGIYSTPIFQVLLWFGALIFIIPFLILFIKRKYALNKAAYVGNIHSRKFHCVECEYQQRISSDLLRYPLTSASEGMELGFKPCNWCKPNASNYFYSKAA